MAEETDLTELEIFICEGLFEYNSFRWGYGKLTGQLKIVYINKFYGDILDFVIRRKMQSCDKDVLLNIRMIHKINECRKFLKNDNFTPQGKLFKTNVFNNKLVKYKYLKLFGSIDPQEREEYEELVKEYNPVYIILINKFRTKTLKQLPLELIRYMNEFLF
jgi:hypothetical protein